MSAESHVRMAQQSPGSRIGPPRDDAHRHTSDAAGIVQAYQVHSRLRRPLQGWRPVSRGDEFECKAVPCREIAGLVVNLVGIRQLQIEKAFLGALGK